MSLKGTASSVSKLSALTMIETACARVNLFQHIFKKRLKPFTLKDLKRFLYVFLDPCYRPFK